MARILLCGTQNPKSYSSKVFVNSKVIERLDKIEAGLVHQTKQTSALTKSYFSKADFSEIKDSLHALVNKARDKNNKMDSLEKTAFQLTAKVEEQSKFFLGKIESIESRHNQLYAEVVSLKDLLCAPKVEEESQTDSVLSTSESEMFLPSHTPEPESSIPPEVPKRCPPPCPSGSSSLYNTPVWLSGQQVTVSGGAEPVPKVGAPFSQTSQIAEDHVTKRELLEVVKLAINCVSNVTSKCDDVDDSRSNNFVENFEPCHNFPGQRESCSGYNIFPSQQFFSAPKRRFRTKVFTNQNFFKISGGNRGNQGYSNQERYSDMFPYNPGSPNFHSSPSSVHFLDYSGTQQPQTIWNTAYRPRKFSF